MFNAGGESHLRWNGRRGTLFWSVCRLALAEVLVLYCIVLRKYCTIAEDTNLYQQCPGEGETTCRSTRTFFLSPIVKPVSQRTHIGPCHCPVQSQLSFDRARPVMDLIPSTQLAGAADSRYNCWTTCRVHRQLRSVQAHGRAVVHRRATGRPLARRIRPALLPIGGHGDGWMTG